MQVETSVKQVINASIGAERIVCSGDALERVIFAAGIGVEQEAMQEFVVAFDATADAK